jgi:hypothetical protein
MAAETPFAVARSASGNRAIGANDANRRRRAKKDPGWWGRDQPGQVRRGGAGTTAALMIATFRAGIKRQAELFSLTSRLANLADASTHQWDVELLVLVSFCLRCHSAEGRAKKDHQSPARSD